MPGNDLLSHGETPHYHRRSSVSLLSSGWDQVGPERYCCQANCFREQDRCRPFLRGLYFGDSLLNSKLLSPIHSTTEELSKLSPNYTELQT